MADLTNSSWSETDSSNTQPAPSGFPSGILPSQVGGVVRAMMGATKRAYNHGNAMVSSMGSANAYVLTYEQPLQNGYVRGEVFRWFANHTNSGAATLNINGAGARPLLRADGSALVAGEIVIGQVITVVFDGANFAAQNVTSKDFKASASITVAGDAVLSLEDTSAPANSYRRKSIFSTRNDSNTGNDWLFRQTRPSDGAFEDFRLKNGTGGTIWTTGNFNPDIKANLAGAAFSGDITAYRAGSPNTGVLYLGTSGGRFLYYDGGNYVMPGAQLYVNGSQVWKRDDFDPNTKVTVRSQPRFNGVLPSLSGEAFIYSDGNTSNIRFRSGSSPNYKYAGLNDDATFQNFSGGFDSAGSIRATGDLRTNGRLIVGEDRDASWIEMRDTDGGTRYVHNNSGVIGFVGSGGDWVLRVGDDGAVWTKQFGDLAARIEDRAYAQAVARRDEANANANNRVAKTGDTMSGNLSIEKDDPGIWLTYPNITRKNLFIGSDGALRLRDQNGQDHIRITGDGQVWTQQLGDLNSRIENRASAYASNRVARSGDVMSGDLTISKGSPQLQLLWGGIYRWGIMTQSNAELQFRNADDGDTKMALRTDGSLWTKQLGDINDRIEKRAREWAETRQGTLGFVPVEQGNGPNQNNNKVRLGWDGGALRLSVDGGDQERIVSRSWCNPIVDIRMTIAGDLGNDWNNNYSYTEPYSGAVVTSRASGLANNNQQMIFGLRWRYLQKQDSYGNWYTVGYA